MATPDAEGSDRQPIEIVVEDDLAARLDSDRGAVAYPLARLELGSPRSRLPVVAAAGVMALIGYGLLSARAVSDLPGPEASSAGGLVAIEPRPRASPALRLFPAAGALEPGWHNITLEGYPFAINVPASDWVSGGPNPGRSGGRLSKGARGAADAALIEFWSPDHVYADPCGQSPGRALGPLAGDLAAAIGELPDIDVAGPFDVTVLYGPPVKHLVLTIPDQVACESRPLRLWYDTQAGPRLPAVPGSRIDVWIANWGGPSYGAARIVIEAETYRGAGRDVELEVASVIGSMIPNRDAPEPLRLRFDEAARQATVDRIDAVCSAATDRFLKQQRALLGAGEDPLLGLRTLDEAIAWSDAAVRATDAAIAELRAITPPQRDRDMVDWLLSFLEPPIDALRDVPAAAAAADAAAVEELLREHVRRTHEKDWRVSFYSGGWHTIAASLRSCPVALLS